MIKKFIKRFFKQVEETPLLPPSEDELVDGQAFKIKHYPLDKPICAQGGDTLKINLHYPSEGVDETIEEEIESKCISTPYRQCVLMILWDINMQLVHCLDRENNMMT